MRKRRFLIKQKDADREIWHTIGTFWVNLDSGELLEGSGYFHGAPFGRDFRVFEQREKK